MSISKKELADALRQFGNIPGEVRPEVRGLPTNAITLWRHIVLGVERVADHLDPPQEMSG